MGSWDELAVSKQSMCRYVKSLNFKKFNELEAKEQMMLKSQVLSF
jgi:hypothetical protein